MWSFYISEGDKMNYAGILHYADQRDCFFLEDGSLRIRLMVASSDVSAIYLHTTDKYISHDRKNTDACFRMERYASDFAHDYFRLDLRIPSVRDAANGHDHVENKADSEMKGLSIEHGLSFDMLCLRYTFEIIDGQQRTISICQYVNGDFAFNFRYFHNLQPDEQEQILNYELQIYICSGTDSEKLKWFRTINIAGEALTEQELRNAVYAGSWVSDAKRYFSKNGAPAAKIGSDYLNGSAIRQDYLETAIDWISDGNIEVYMSNHQHDASAAPLWQFFQSVITWIETSFRPTKERKKIMKGVEWGMLYKLYKDQVFDYKAIDEEVKRLILDDDVTKKTGIYPYILTRKEKYLSIRAFTDAQKLSAYERQMGFCADCGQHFELSQMEADHITPWCDGGRTVADNCQMLCKECNRRKSGK